MDVDKTDDGNTPKATSVVPYYVPPAYVIEIDALAAWFECAAKSSEHGEIEGKIGVFNRERKKFDSVVDPAWFNDKLTFCMQPGTRWDRVEEETTTSYLFENGTRGVKHADETATFVKKIRKSNLDFEFANCPLNVRLSHSLELPTDPPCAAALWVRLRRRKSFYYKQWRFDFSYIFEGATYQAARKQPLKHEIEVECIDPRPPPGLDYRYMATSLMMKLQDLVTPNGTDAASDGRPLTLLRRRVRTTKPSS